MYPFLNRFTKDGFIPSKIRKAIPIGHKQPLTTAQQFAQLMRSSEFARHVAAQGRETFEEAEDFDIPDDPIDPNTPYEKDFDLASAASSHHGVTEPVSEADLLHSRNVIAKVQKALAKNKGRVPATPPAPTPSEGPTDPDSED